MTAMAEEAVMLTDSGRLLEVLLFVLLLEVLPEFFALSASIRDTVFWGALLMDEDEGVVELSLLVRTFAKLLKTLLDSAG